MFAVFITSMVDCSRIAVCEMHGLTSKIRVVDSLIVTNIVYHHRAVKLEKHVVPIIIKELLFL